jgi:hypothetical protein
MTIEAAPNAERWCLELRIGAGEWHRYPSDAAPLIVSSRDMAEALIGEVRAGSETLERAAIRATLLEAVR